MLKNYYERNKNYIPMCREAKEIRELWKPTLGDIYYKNAQDENDVDEIVMVIDEKMNHFGLPRRENFHLPHQWQLQEMLDFGGSPECLWWVKLNGMKQFADKSWLNEKRMTPYKTMEQLWLAFMMKENYNKIWNGKKWEEGR